MPAIIVYYRSIRYELDIDPNITLSDFLRKCSMTIYDRISMKLTIGGLDVNEVIFDFLLRRDKFSVRIEKH